MINLLCCIKLWNGFNVLLSRSFTIKMFILSNIVRSYPIFLFDLGFMYKLEGLWHEHFKDKADILFLQTAYFTKESSLILCKFWSILIAHTSIALIKLISQDVNNSALAHLLSYIIIVSRLQPHKRFVVVYVIEQEAKVALSDSGFAKCKLELVLDIMSVVSHKKFLFITDGAFVICQSKVFIAVRGN